MIEILETDSNSFTHLNPINPKLNSAMQCIEIYPHIPVYYTPIALLFEAALEISPITPAEIQPKLRFETTLRGGTASAPTSDL